MSAPFSRIPDPREARLFHFGRCEFEPGSGRAQLCYRFDNGPELIEQIDFPAAPWPKDKKRRAAFQRALHLLHLVAGVSYFKAGLAAEFAFDEPAVAAAIGPFLTELYQNGLAEFACVNQLDSVGRIRFPETSDRVEGGAGSVDLPERALVALGGGKDSLVGIDLVSRAGIETRAACVGGAKLIGETARVAGQPLLRIGRKLAPELAEMNRAGAWNGHVPVTAINSAILLCAAILYGYRYIVFSNERSADEATLTGADGVEINHQYSKSSVFERAFRDVIRRHVAIGVEYFSVLRPFSELEIVRRFSAMKSLHGVYSSCNRNFHQQGSRIEGRWCGNCPKCRFAALSLAAFLSPAEVSGIIGADLLDDPGQSDGFRALCELERNKPFECVGEAGESRAALAKLAADDRWRRHAVVAELAPELSRVVTPSLQGQLQRSERHFIPAAVLKRLEGLDDW